MSLATGLTRALVTGLVLGLLAPHAWARPKHDDDDDDSSDTDDSDDTPRRHKKPAPKSDDDDGGDEDAPKRGHKKPKPKSIDADDADKDGDKRKPRDKGNEDKGDDDKGDEDKGDEDKGNEDFKKQDLTGHDLGTAKKENTFEKDRFFVDKVDEGAKTTLIQGSMTSTSFVYHESGDKLAPTTSGVPAASQFSRLFTDLRLQTDFRHISGGQWDGRVDVRGRVVPSESQVTSQGGGAAAFTPGTATTVQSGFLGQNELELKELWLVRNGKQSDVFLGRQFIPDLAGVKIDGVRIDYASSSKFTLLGFGGLYPIRGSRSITTDYEPLLSEPDVNGKRTSAGKFTGAGGFGAAYRTIDAYGSFGGVVLAPFSSEQPRVFGTSSGYWRYGPKLDVYHFAVIDLVGSSGFALTNLSAGINYKPDQRLRATASLNHVDTDTLNVQAQAFLSNPDPALQVVQNEAYLTRIATNEVRGSLSAGLGEMQRYEVTAAATFRYRGEITLSQPPSGMVITTLPAAQSIELYGSVTDRRSFKDARIGIDGSRIFRVGDASFQRSNSLSLRVFAARELANGHGEWEAEVAYTDSQDDDAGKTCLGGTIAGCFGSSEATILSIGGTLYYRFNRDWFAIASLFLNHEAITEQGMMADPPVTGLSGLLRIAYRF